MRFGSLWWNIHGHLFLWNPVCLLGVSGYLPRFKFVTGGEHVGNTCPIFNDFHIENILEYEHHRHRAGEMTEVNLHNWHSSARVPLCKFYIA